MPVDKSSLPTEDQHDDPVQIANTLVDNQDIKKDDLVTANDNHDNSSSPNDQVAKEPLQTTPLDANKKDNTSTPKLEATTNEPTKASTTPLLDPSSDPAAPKAILPSNENNSSPLNAQTTTTPEASSTQNTNSNVDKQSTSISTNDHINSLPTTEHSTSKTTDSDANKQATHDSSKSSTTMDPTSNQDADSTNQTNPQRANSDNKQDANQSTHTSQQPNNESSTSQIPESDTNKQANAVATDDLSKSSKAMVPTSNQDPDSVDQSNPLKTDSKTNEATDQSTKTVSTDPQTDKKNPSSETNPREDRKQLQTLISQELDIVKKTCPKLGEHGETIRKEAEKVTKEYEKLISEGHGIKELKTLKRSVTKLKLQIPPRYMTYDDSDKQKKHQYGVKSSDNISTTLQRKIPRLHDKVFYHSPICNAIHLRFNALKHELKPCLLCFTVFPENAIISRRSMIYWWIGEGLVPGEDDNAEESANKIFQELMDKDFIEPETKRSRPYVTNCKMNPMVRAALVMIADKVKFFDFDQYGNPKDFGKFDEIESPEDMPVIYPLGEPNEFFNFYDKNKKIISGRIEFDDSYEFAALPKEDNQELVNRNGVPIDENKKIYLYERKQLTTKSYKVCLMGSGLSKGIPWENLHMLFNVKDVILQFKPEWFLRMKNINVLFLGKWQSSATHHIEVEDFEFEKSFDSLNNVRFFSLQGISRISKLPASISKLKSLLILDLRACHNLEEIPETIGLLKCLTHLDMSECYLLRKIPKELSSLESLQVLKGFVVVELLEKNTCTLQDLTKLENLRKLSMYTHMKDFPQETHLEALQKLETLRKLTILWGGHESKEETNKGKEDAGNDKKHNCLASKVKEFLSKKKRVQGTMRRMNAFNNSTLGMRLEKLDLKCFPHSKTPNWLTPGNLQGLKKLYIRGGHFSDLGQYQETIQCDDLLPKDTWRVETLRLKYLDELNMEWRELQNLFPKLKYLEKVKCPKLTLFPCNEKGVWMKKGSSNT